MSSRQLLCLDEDSCMASAVNIYFQERIFENNQDFYERQKRLVVETKGKYEKHCDISLIGVLKHQGHIYKRVYDFISEHICLNKWPSEAKSNHKRAIVD